MFLGVLVSVAMSFGGPGADSSAPVNKTLLLRLVNDIRKTGCNCGDVWYPSAPPLNWDGQLEKAALVHSRDMSDKKYFSHDSKDGSDPGARILQQGYTWRTYGENIALGYASEQEAVAGWIKSPGHCKNLMNANYKDVGVGRSGAYWTMNLASH